MLLYLVNFATINLIIRYQERGVIMAYKITDDCIACGSCADECPNDAIISGDDKYTINADECLDCGSCADACPNDAIIPE